MSPFFDAKIVQHFSDTDWDADRWPDFSPVEFACSCCGELYYAPYYFDCFQALRSRLGEPVRLNSAHRCPLHNARVGGGLRSQHKRLAGDISLRSLSDPHKLLRLALETGFRGFGFYGTFLHIDMGRPRKWWSDSAGQTWGETPYTFTPRLAA
ncbi:YcbK family protein [Limisalsivibrio acetivorans]|uniref:YcbK family protein n=1 Tax=Limisalsivibrio acetivorans TaxID=1304888 RepID=UPI00138ACEED|nr:D-Ala-D-Ala carboxypeptidase family metallohydrolase [Limisalsivibrio acetivorans]